MAQLEFKLKSVSQNGITSTHKPENSIKIWISQK